MKNYFVVLLLVCALTQLVTCQNYDEYSYEDANYDVGLEAATTTTQRPRPRPTSRPRPTTPRPQRPNVVATPPNGMPPRRVDKNGQLIGCPCLTTQETNRVCGTDGNTYGNLGKLKCAQRCDHIVEVNHLGSCTKRPN